MNDYYGMTDSSFVGEGQKLFASYQALFATGTSSDGIIEPIRQWLDAATARQCTLHSHIWGGLCQAILERHPQDSKLFDAIGKLAALLNPGSEPGLDQLAKERKLFDADRDRIAGYLHAVSNISKEDFFRVTDFPATRTPFHSRGYEQNPACDALINLFKALVVKTGGSYVPMQKALFETNAWDPLPLLRKLQSWREEQTAYGRAKSVAGVESFVNSAQGSLLCVLLDATAYSNWKPSDEVVCAELWSLVDFSCRGEQTAIIRKTLWESMPNQIGWALQSVEHVNNFTPDALAQSFSLPEKEVDVKAMLLGMVQMYRYFRDGAEYTPAVLIEEKRGFAPRIQEHHPELHSLVSMHMTLFPDEMEEPEMMQMLFSGYQALSRTHEPVSPEAWTIPGGL